MGEMMLAGENIKAGDAVVVSIIDGRAYTAGWTAGWLLGNAVEQIREGFRVTEKDGDVREDDA
jgi:hypothetical protein